MKGMHKLIYILSIIAITACNETERDSSKIGVSDSTKSVRNAEGGDKNPYVLPDADSAISNGTDSRLQNQDTIQD
jgi:hypothetical protein